MAIGNLGNLRLVEPAQEPEPSDAVTIEFAPDENAEKETTDEVGNVIQIEHDDGTITVSIDGTSLKPRIAKDDLEWFSNLVDEIDATEVGNIANELLQGIEADDTSRNEWLQSCATGIQMLGLQLEVPSAGSSTDGAPVEGMSRVRHPLMLEAVLRFQANARSEFLPTDGPVKIRDDGSDQVDDLASAYERDFNHYLTYTATEYYPDTDRMFLMLGFQGMSFKKVYFCPLRNRPVSETVDAEDLIVNNSATDLKNAKRVTHRVFMSPNTVRRMQIIGAYKDVVLPEATDPDLNPVDEAKREQQGLAAGEQYQKDNDREIYECYCELNIKGYEHKKNGEETGLKIPYIVTIDKASQTVLSIVRNYDEDTAELPIARDTFIDYSFIPGFGYYAIGLLHILGNTTNAITAAWRELLDAGMFSNFPGFLVSDAGGRQDSNIFRVPPGGGAQVKTGTMPINQAVMPLPYKEPSQALMALVENIAQNGQRIGGIAELSVGEGKQDAPVGTTIAMIDQATKVLNSVHKRMHAKQAQELQLIAKVFKEHPDAFWKANGVSAQQWDETTFRKALEDYDLVPQADPNTSSQLQRVMKVVALKQLQAANPTLYDAQEVDKAALTTIGWANPERFFNKNPQATPPDPRVIAAQAKAENDKANTQIKAAEVQQKGQLEAAKVQSDQQAQQIDLAMKTADAHQRQEEFKHDNRMRQFEESKTIADLQNDERDRRFEINKQMVDVGQDLINSERPLSEANKFLKPALDNLKKEFGE